MVELTSEDAKLVTLARATAARVNARESAAIRDENGRTYAAASLDLASVEVSAIGICVGMAHSSGSRSLEAAVVLTDAGEVALADRAILREFGGEEIVLHRGIPNGTVVETSATLLGEALN